MSDTPARVLIVDDERLARRRLLRLLEGRSGIGEVGEATNGLEAVRVIEADRPDLVFLDIQMPDLDGFGVVETIGPEAMPLVIFVTAYDQYALDAFEVSACDYLLKPFENSRFEAALERALARLAEHRSHSLYERLSCLLDGHRLSRGAEPTAGEGEPFRRRFTLHRRGEIFFLPVDDVDWIGAEGAYVRLHTGERSHLVRGTLGRLENELDPARYVRIHRSTIVRIDRVEALRPLTHGEYRVVLRSGAELKLSRSYRQVLGRLKDG